MTNQIVSVHGRKVEIARTGAGEPLVWLHGFADVFGASAALLPFHEQLGKVAEVIAPAHPGCGESDETDDVEDVHAVVAGYIDLFDALGLDRFVLAGSCIGGWIAAEIAVQVPERVMRLALVGATGLFVSGQPIADIFWVAQPEDGIYYNDLRHMLFAAPDSAEGTALFPDGRGAVAQELLRYKMFRFASQVGFSPPYLYDRKLRDRLGRYRGPALIVWGEHDHMVPRAHADAYAEGFPAAKLALVPGAGHAAHVENPSETAKLIAAFLAG